ncbi:MAG: hypothetical protein GY711_26150 [bacterium]|nr:hypothetical protein [bacterium]
MLVPLTALLLLAQEAPDRVTQLDAHVRTGVFHSAFALRLVDPAGAPVAGARVSVLGRAPAWGKSEAPAATSRSDGEGRVWLSGVSSADPLVLRIVPPPPYGSVEIPVGGVTGGLADLGEVELAPYEGEQRTRIEGRLLLAGGAPLAGIVVTAYARAGDAAITGPDGSFTLNCAGRLGDALVVSSPGGPFRVGIELGAKFVPYRVDASEPFEVELAVHAESAIEVRGVFTVVFDGTHDPDAGDTPGAVLYGSIRGVTDVRVTVTAL